MSRTFLIFWRTYWGNITQGSYLAFTFGLPLFFILVPVAGSMILLWAIQTVIPPTDFHPIGVVDQSGLFTIRVGAGDPVQMLPFDTLQEAAAAHEAGNIQAYYQIPPNYLTTGIITVTYKTAPSLEVDQMVEAWIYEQIQMEVPDKIERRYTAGAFFAHEGTEGETTFSALDFLKWGGIYVVVYFVQVAGSFTSNYMYGTIASEAHDRTIELILSSVTPRQFLIGKFFGLLAVGLTQLAVWVIPGLIGVGWFLSRFGQEFLPYIFPWEHTVLIISTLFGAYVLFQVMAAAAGLLRISGGAGPQLFGLLEWASGLGIVYATYFLPRNPDTTFAIIGSLFPLTSPLVLLIRLVASEVPAWQVIVSQGLLWGTIMFGLLSLGGLLKRNLVSYAPRFRIIAWVRERFRPKVTISKSLIPPPP